MFGGVLKMAILKNENGEPIGFVCRRKSNSEWFIKVLLPSLTEKFESRNPHFKNIFLSPKQANICRQHMENLGNGKFTLKLGDKEYFMKEREDGNCVFWIKEVL